MQKIRLTQSKIKKSQYSGFGLLEVLLAAGLITILIGGAAVLGTVVFRNTQINSHRTQAMYLNQEALEAVKQIQRTNWTKQDSSILWNQGLAPNIYSLLRQGDSWTLLSYSSDNSITLNNVDFDRKITIEKVKMSKEMIKDDAFRSGDIVEKVTSEVSWEDFGKTQSVKTQTLISNWKPI